MNKDDLERMISGLRWVKIQPENRTRDAVWNSPVGLIGIRPPPGRVLAGPVMLQSR